MSTRADWYTAGLDLDDPLGDEPDPFAMPVEEVGDPIDLHDQTARLSVRLVELVSTERALYEEGVECPLRDRHDTTCLACPHSQANNRHHRLSPLCRCGREQERVQTRLAVERLKFEPADYE